MNVRVLYHGFACKFVRIKRTQADECPVCYGQGWQGRDQETCSTCKGHGELWVDINSEGLAFRKYTLEPVYI